VRAEDKRIGVDRDESEVEQTRRQDRAHADERLLETGDDRATAQDQAEELAKAAHCQSMMAAVAAVFRGDMRPLDGLVGFGLEEMEALKYLEAAVRGRDPKLTHLVYAADRRDLLEQALAVLYPTLSHGMEQSAAPLAELHDVLVGQVTLLRGHLSQLEDAEEDVFELRQRVTETKADDGDKDDDDEPGDGEDPTGGTPRPDDEDDDDDTDRGDVGDPGVAP